MVRSVRGLLAVVLLVLLAVLGVLVGTGSAVADEDAAAGAPGVLRIAHLSPDTPAVAVALAQVPVEAPDEPLTDPGPDVAETLRYGDLTGYQELPPGRYAVSIRAAGARPDVPPVLSAAVDLPAGSARTVALTGRFADLALAPLPADDLDTPAAGEARVRVVAAAASAGPLRASLAEGPVLADRLPFPDAGDRVPVPAGAATLRLVPEDGAPTELAIDLADGAVVTLLVLDGPDGDLTVRPVVDAARPTELPTGSVEAGGNPASGWPGFATRTLSRALADLRPPLPGDGAAPSAPVRLRVPAAGVDIAPASVALDATGALVPPSDPDVAGWWSGGVLPGATGPAVLTGHVDWAGQPAVFADLGRLSPGDPVLVDRADGETLRFEVTRTLTVAKEAFPTGQVYGATPGPELRLITCGGTFDRASGSYPDNVIVFARLVR